MATEIEPTPNALPEVLVAEYRKAKPAEPEQPLLGPLDQVIASKPSNAPIEEETAALLNQLTRDLGARRTAETGMAAGRSAVAIASVHAKRGAGLHTCIDPHQTTLWKSAALELCEKAQVRDFVDLVEEPSEYALPRLAREGTTLDLAFVDGLHLFDHVLLDFFYFDRMLRPGGVIVFHDTWMTAVQNAVGYIVSNRAYERPAGRTPELEMGTNVVVLTKLADDDRDWFFDEPFDDALSSRSG